MPMYDYVCEEHGEFECINSINEREIAKCPECDKDCQLTSVQGVNLFMAKTKYIAPPKATRKFGFDRMVPHVRKKWV